MKLNYRIQSAALLAAFSLLATPVFAQQRNHDENRGARERARPAQGHGRAESRGPVESQSRAQSQGRVEPQSRAFERAQPPVGTAIPRAESRGYDRAPQRYEPRYEPRNEGQRYEGRSYEPRNYAPRYEYRDYRPYVFRPRFQIGFGIYLGYPVPYGYAYPYPVTVYGYQAPPDPVIVGPGSAAYGGVSLEINPPDAGVYVDGAYAGVVGEFDGTRQALTLTGGRHRVEISAPGYQPLVFDVDVLPGQVVPYRGDLQPM